MVHGLSRLFFHYRWMARSPSMFYSDSLASIVAVLPNVDRSLRHLDISRDYSASWSRNDPSIGSSVSKAVTKLNNLETFSSPWTLSDAALLHIASLSSLVSLSLWCQSPLNCFVPTPSNRDSHPYFPALSAFSLLTENWLTAIQWLDALVTPLSYLALSIVTPRHISANDPFCHLHIFLDRLYNSHHRASLETLKLRDETIFLRPSQYIGFFGHFRPLLTLVHLRVIHIWCDIDFNDAWIEIAAKSFPRLESLILKGCLTPIGITLRGLLPLVIHCPSLSTLTIPVNALVSENPDWLTNQDFSANTRMVEIDMATWSFSSFPALVPWLLMMFTSLRKATMDTASFYFTDAHVFNVYERWRPEELSAMVVNA